ncbi:GNAT family N-acetyltransferase [Erythrobacter sp. EC-HK427]|uniref:GNAT family N-acetyltransferase n=1 Tax=Erythrobacter sp. EC-HK427 TaxID=2038396 RepID=UPI0012520A26|nr:GNAT family N-acetyltransferase [Erythrobacter sp. EC-HK427]VVT20054.1 Cellulose biosynthesis protein CelD [Erythrobacter sp. EC-HK427]
MALARVNNFPVQHDLNFDGLAIVTKADARVIAESAVAKPDPVLVAQGWRVMDSADNIARWDALARQASEPNPFFESWSLLPALAAFDPDQNVRLLTLEADGRLVGLVPLRLDRRYYGHPIPHWRIWTHHNLFLCAPLVARGFEHVFWQHLLGWVDRHAGIAAFLHCAHMPADTPLVRALAEVLASSKRPAATVQHEQRAMLAGDGDAESYAAASLSAKKRKELRRQHRRLTELGTLETVRQLGEEDLESWIDSFLALELRSWKGAAGSALASDPLTATAFRQALTGAAHRGRLERLAITLDGAPIAMLASFLAPPGAFSFKTAFDEDYSRFSPGVLLQLDNLDLLARDRIQWCDSCAAEDHPMIDHIWRERRAIDRYSIAIGGALRRRAFAALIRQETGAAPGGIA